MPAVTLWSPPKSIEQMRLSATKALFDLDFDHVLVLFLECLGIATMEAERLPIDFGQDGLLTIFQIQNDA